MKKILSLLLCAALICGCAAGCARPQEKETEAPTETAAPTEWVLEETAEVKKYEGTELVFISIWTEDAAEAAVLTQAAEVFRMTTGAAVRFVWSQDYADPAVNGDIYQLPGNLLPGFSDRLLDLTELARSAGYDRKSISALTDQVLSRCGKLAAIPQVPYLSGFYCSREAFESCGVTQPPQTWEQFVSVCAALQAGGWEPLALENESADDVLMLHLTQYLGAEAALKVAQSGGWEDAAQQPVTDLFDFVRAGYLAYGMPAAYPAGQNKLGLSNVAMVWGSNALCPQVEEAALADLSWMMFPYPGVGGAEPVISVDSDVLAVDAGCAMSQAAFDFILLLTTGEYDQLRADLTRGIPADPSNVSPIAGALETLQIAQVVEPVQAEFSEKQLAAILRLWKGYYEENASFPAEMDQLYPQS